MQIRRLVKSVNNLNIDGNLADIYLSECTDMLVKFEKIVFDTGSAGKITEVGEMFRLLHTLKGSAAMMEFQPLVDAAHLFEDILAVLRQKVHELSSDEIKLLVDIGLEFTAYFKTEFEHIEKGNAPKRDESLFHQLESFALRIGVKEKEEQVQSSTEIKSNELNNGEKCVRVILKKCSMPHIRAFIISRSIEKMCLTLSTQPEGLEKNIDSDEYIQNKGFEISFVPKKPDITDEIIKKVSAQPFVVSCKIIGSNNGDEEEAARKIFTRSLSVPQETVNRLISSIEEIAVAETALEGCVMKAELQGGAMYSYLSALRNNIATASILVTAIGAHKVGSVFMQMQRAIRSMANDLGKDIKVKTEGDDIKVDKSTLELLSDSLIHIVRNAVDHGIENAAQRSSKGKEERGEIRLSAVKKNDYLIVTVTDDGKGIDKTAVLDKADKLGKLTKDKSLYSDKEAYNLLLSQGFTTSSDVTKYSGRGVGLDTVMKRIRQIGGSIFVDSEKDKGSTFGLNIPVTLMIIDGIEVELTGGEEVVMPANAIGHILSLSEQDIISSYIERDGILHKEVSFPGERANADGKTYALLFTEDYGRYFLRAKRVTMMSSYYVKKLPEYISDALSGQNIYSGCVLCEDSILRCVLDVNKLVALTEASGRQGER